MGNKGVTLGIKKYNVSYFSFNHLGVMNVFKIQLDNYNSEEFLYGFFEGTNQSEYTLKALKREDLNNYKVSDKQKGNKSTIPYLKLK